LSSSTAARGEDEGERQKSLGDAGVGQRWGRGICSPR
jgi:hypothetical protein